MRRWAVTVAAVVLAGALARAQGAEGGEKPEPPKLHAGDPAPAFGPMKLHNPDEAGMQTFTLGHYVGPDAETPKKAVLISFFATWCGPCKRELPFLVKLSHEYGAKGLQVVSISIDKEPEQFAKVKELVKQNHIDYPVVMDRFNLLARRYLGEKTALPSLFLVKADGTIAMVKQGYGEDASAFLTSEIEKVLGG